MVSDMENARWLWQKHPLESALLCFKHQSVELHVPWTDWVIFNMNVSVFKRRDQFCDHNSSLSTILMWSCILWSGSVCRPVCSVGLLNALNSPFTSVFWIKRQNKFIIFKSIRSMFFILSCLQTVQTFPSKSVADVHCVSAPDVT